jgi:hypothetical protein
MKIFKYVAIALLTNLVMFGLIVGTTQPARPDDKSIDLTPGFSPDPQVSVGMSGGSHATSDCGYVKPANAPNLILTLAAPFRFLRASVQADGDVTLLVEGPNGHRICSDDVNGLMPEISGAAAAGTYKIWIGDFVGNPEGSYQYQLVLREK